MIRRQTVITFTVPATFEATRVETCNGKQIGFGEGGRMSIDGLEVVSLSRRGHKDPATMRDLALAGGAVGKEMTVTHHSIEHLESRQDRKFIVSTTGPANPIRVTI